MPSHVPLFLNRPTRAHRNFSFFPVAPRRYTRPIATQPSKLRTIALRLFKSVSALFIFCCGISFLLLGTFFFTDKTIQVDALVRLSLSSFLALLGFILPWSAWRLLQHPLSAPAPPSSPEASWLDEIHSRFTCAIPPENLAEIRNFLLASDLPSARDVTTQLLERHPRDVVLLWIQSDTLLALNEGAAAEKTCDLLLAELIRLDPSIHYEPAIYFIAAAKRLHAIMLQNDGRFENESTAVLQSVVTDAAKVILLDQLACIPLMQDKPELYPLAEFCARKALDIAAGTPTLQGTLGALFAERGQLAAAEPLLRACYDQTSDPTNRGITSYYLALLAAHDGDSATARKLAKQSLALYPEPWLTKKATTLLTRLKA